MIFEEKIVVVTGGTGFLGRYAVHALLREGYEVHVASHTWDGPFDPSAMLRVHHCNLLHESDSGDLLQMIRPTHLLHLAWETTPGEYWNSPNNIEWVEASLRLLREFHACGGKRVLLAGSCAEYDWSSGTCHETQTPLQPNSFYGTCKQAFWETAEPYAKLTGLSAAWGRLFHLYGPGEAPQRFVSSLVESLLNNEPAVCHHGGHLRDYLHVADAAEAMVALLDSSVTGPVNIASGRAVKLEDLATTLAELMGGKQTPRIELAKDTAENPHEIAAETQRLNEEVGWTPSITLDEGLRSVVNTMRAQSRSKAA